MTPRVFSRAEFGSRLRQARQLRGYSQYALAHVVGLDQDRVSRWERAEHVPRLDLLASFAIALEVDAEWLLFGTPGRGPESC